MKLLKFLIELILGKINFWGGNDKDPYWENEVEAHNRKV